MSLYAKWVIGTQSIAIIVGFAILWLSLCPTGPRRALMAGLYAIVALGLAVVTVFPIFFGISMANAFGPRRISALAYIPPILIAAFFLVPAYALFPFVGIATARRIGFVVFGLLLPAILVIQVLFLQFGSHADRGLFAIPHGVEALALTALWLRVYECNLSNQTRSPNHAMERTADRQGK